MFITYYGNDKVTLFDLSKKGIERVIVDDENNIEIINQDDQWYLLFENQKNIIEPDNIYEFSTNETIHVIITEDSSSVQSNFVNYFVSSSNPICIGRARDNDIIINNLRVSNHHLSIQFMTDGRIEISDKGSSNGTYVNGTRINKYNAKFGDVIYLLGVKIIIGNQFISINNPDNSVEVLSKKMEILNNQITTQGKCHKEIYMFYPSPRFKRDITTKKFKIDAPPDNQIGESMPMIFMIGPSITMGMASFTTAMFSINNAISSGNMSAAMPSLVMSFGMILGTVMWPVLSKKYEKNKRKKREELRQNKYRDYLEEIKNSVHEEKILQKDILNENFVNIEECISRIEKVKRNLWERNIGQNDFLRFRVGIGKVFLDAEFIYPERKFMLIEDNLLNQMFDYCEKDKCVDNVPITISLYDNFVTGIIGKNKLPYVLAMNLILQIISYYSYYDVKMIFITNSEEFEFVKWLPHTWNNEKTLRFWINDINESKEVISYLNKVFEERMEMNEDEVCDERPYYIIFDLNRELARKIELINKICKEKRNINFSVISICEELKDIPKESSKVVELSLEDGKIYDKNDIRGISLKFEPDKAPKINVNALCKKMANIILDNNSNNMLPENVSFLQMYKVEKIEHLNILNRWKENNSVISLETPIGIDSYGENFYLDLHEKYDGPHGLVAGMTGSGKSEFIMTYILSMAVNYHPYEVSFILIDYKGGGMAKTFEKLPHVAGIITNLDGSSVNRSLVSIQSELKRRQNIFAQVSKKMEISNVDIYKYQQLYREGAVDEPLQHLFIISDEFAELKTQRPEFMEQLISTARIGRSLGVHLILATQKPAGVVDDQIWSNSRFRACLKVQERADSMDMLKRPDAAELSTVGRFYLQVGYNEKFDIGQSAYAGAPYYPMNKAIDNSEDSIQVINSTGQAIKTVKYDRHKNKYIKVEKQIDSITRYICNLAEKENINIRPMWLPELNEVLFVEELKKKYQIKGKMNKVLYPIIGEYDDPENQRQDILRLPLSKEGNAIIYGVSGSGKTTLLTTVIFELIEEHTPEEVNIYILDFDSEKLKVFNYAPHVGDIVYAYEREKVNNLFKMMMKEVGKRKKVLRDYEGDYSSYISNHDDMSYIVIVINNYTMFNELYEQELEAFEYLTREGAKYGIYFIISCSKVNGVSGRINQNFHQRIVLQFNSEDDYMMILGKTDGLYPAKVKGRGLIKMDRIYEYQTALAAEKENHISYIKDYCNAYSEIWSGKCAKHIPVLPDTVNYEFISKYQNTGLLSEKSKIPIGVDTDSHEIIEYNFFANYINLVASSEMGYVNFALCFSRLIDSYYDFKCIFFDLDNSIDTWEKIEVVKKHNEVCRKIEELFELVLYRNNTYKDMEAESKSVDFENVVVIFSGFSKLLSIVNDVQKEKLDLLLEKGKTEYHINIIIADNIQNLKSIMYEKWYKGNFNKNSGIYIGSNITNQYMINISESGNGQLNRISEPFGYVISNAKTTKAKMIWEEYNER